MRATVGNQLEELVLAIERAYLAIPDLTTRIVAAEQSLAMWWASLGQSMATPTPTPTPTATIFGCCTGIMPNPTISFTDSIWGLGTLTWGGTSAWDGWLSGLAWPGAGGCGAVAIAVYYQYDSATDQVTMQWLTDSTSHCPVASTAGFITPPAGQIYASTTPSVVYDCDATPVTGTATSTGGAAELLLRTGHPSEIVTVYFTGATTPHTVYPPVGGCSPCVSTTLTLVDSLYGNATLTWNGTDWVGTHTGIAYPGGGGTGCGATTIAITYTLVAATGNINVAWHVTANCPTAGVPNTNTTFTGVYTCTGPDTVVATNASAAAAPQKLRAGAASQTFTITF